MPNLRDKILVPAAGHWLQQEQAREFNEALLAFVVTDYGPLSSD